MNGNRKSVAFVNDPWTLASKLLRTRIVPERLRVSAYYRLKPSVPQSAFENVPLKYAPGLTLNLQPGDDSHAAMAAVGVYEPSSSRLAARLARSGGLLVDVGANYGYYTAIWLANSDRTTAIAIEPSPKVAEELKRNLDANGLLSRTQLYQVAADRQTTRRAFVLSTDGQTGWGRLDEGIGDLTVSAVRLDELVTDQIELLKVDCEGADYWVLEGATELFGSDLIKFVLFENNSVCCKRLGIDPAAAPQLLRQYGYDLKLLRDGNWFASKRT